MARSPRTPPPPRRVQAPTTRKEARDRRTLVLVAAAALLLAALAAGAFFLLRGGEDGDASVAAAMQEAGCEFEAHPAREPGVHISDPDATPEEWTTNPPTSGPHFGQWVIWGEYDEPVRLAEAVHNLEHGGIVTYYGEDVAQADVDALRAFYREDPVAMLLAPLPDLEDEIVLTAWHAPNAESGNVEEGAEGALARCTSFDERAFRAFRDEYRFQGPERIPPENLQPGM